MSTDPVTPFDLALAASKTFLGATFDGVRVVSLTSGVAGFADGYRFRPLINMAAAGATTPLWQELNPSPEWFAPAAAPAQASALADITAYIAAQLAAPAAVPVPQSVSPRQLRQWLITAGKLDAVTAALDAIPDATEKALAQNWWDYSTTFERSHPLVAQIGGALSMSSADIDAAFVAAAAL